MSNFRDTKITKSSRLLVFEQKQMLFLKTSIGLYTSTWVYFSFAKLIVLIVRTYVLFKTQCSFLCNRGIRFRLSKDHICKKYLIGFELLVPLLLQVPWILPQYLYIYLYLCNEYEYDGYKSVKSALSSGDIESNSWIEKRTLSS